MANSTIPKLPPDLADELTALATLDDAELQAAAKSSLLPVQRRRLSHLSHAAGRRSLTLEESAELEHLIELYDLAILRRAWVLKTLADRGYRLELLDVGLSAS